MKSNKPFYQKWWLWLVAFFALTFFANNSTSNEHQSNPTNEARSVEVTHKNDAPQAKAKVQELVVKHDNQKPTKQVPPVNKNAAQKTQFSQVKYRRQGKSRVVYIAPTSGKRFHYNPNCRGLRRARGNITKISKKSAVSRGYTLCKWED